MKNLNAIVVRQVIKLKTMKNIWIAILLFAVNGISQSELQTYSQKYPDKNGVFLRHNASVNITLDKAGEIIIESTNDSERLFLNDNFKYYVEDEVGYSSFSKITSLDPYVYIPIGEKYKRIKITDFEEQDDHDQSIFHDDNKKSTFIYSGLTKGGKTSLSYSKKMSNPYFFGTFYFSTYLPVEESKYVVETPVDMEITYKLFGNEQEKIEYSVETKGNIKIHTWKAKELTELKFESGAVDISYVATHMQLYINTYKVKGEDRHIIRDLDDLYSYYRGFVNEINSDYPELASIADSLTKNLTTNNEKVETIFYWVQDNIKYVAFEDGMGGFIPREAQLVCDRKYGDCKDMASILYAMINSVGVPAYYTWIGSRSIRYDYSELPTTATDNHMICSYNDGEKYVFLDATSKGLPLGMPSGFIQGKQALIGIDKDNYEVVRVPVVSSVDNGMFDTVMVQIENNKVIGVAKVTYFGYSAIDLSDLILNLSAEQKVDFYKSSFKKGNNKCESTVTAERGLEKRGGPLEIDYNFEISDYINSYEDELYVNPFLKKFYANSQINLETSSISKEIGNENLLSNVVYIDIPTGYELTYLPESSSFKHEDFSFDVVIKLNESKKQIEVATIINVNHIVLKSEYFEAWNEMIKKLNKAYSEVITLKKIENE